MTTIIEENKMTGVFRLKVFKAGELLEEYVDKNVIVNQGKIQIAHLLAGEVQGRNVADIAFGTSGTPQEPSDEQITNQWEKPISSFVYPEDNKVQFNWELLVDENNGMAIMEFGLLTEDGLLFARKTRENPIHKALDISLEGQWTINF